MRALREDKDFARLLQTEELAAMPAFLEEQLSAEGAMNQYVSPGELDEVIQAFASDTIVIPINAILPVRAIGKTVKSSHKYSK